MEQVHGVLPQQLQAGHQCIPVKSNTLPQDHTHLQAQQHIVLGHPPSELTTTPSSIGTLHFSVPWPEPPSPLSSSFLASREPSKPQKPESEQVLEFAKRFRKKRIELGFSPDGVTQKVNIQFSYVVVPLLCGSLAQHDMEKMKQYLEGLLIHIERAKGAQKNRQRLQPD